MTKLGTSDKVTLGCIVLLLVVIVPPFVAGYIVLMKLLWLGITQ